MGSYMNFKNYGEAPISGDGGKYPGNNPLARQSSIFNLTFGELQNTFSGLGKDFGSMNMDELLKNLWTAEETQGLTSASVGGEGTGNAPIGNLQKQGSLTLPRTVSQKTVDEVWKYLLNENGDVNDGSGVKDSNGGSGGPNMPQRLQTEMTLEEFLFKAGVVWEDAQPIARPSDGGLYGELLQPNNTTGTGLDLGFQQPSRNAGIMVNRITENNIPMSNQPPSLALNIGGLRSYQQLSQPQQPPPPPPQQQQQQQPKPLFPKQANVAFAPPMNLVHSSQLVSPGTRGPLVAISDLSKKNGLVQGGGLQNREMGTAGLGTGVIKVAAGSPVSQFSPDVIGKSNISSSPLSPASYGYNQGTRGRKSSGGFEKVVERRHRRMIKNRESAARSRARKQAYTLELEAEIAVLKERNEELQKKQAEIMELQNNQIIERMKLPWGGKRVCLRRTLTGPW